MKPRKIEIKSKCEYDGCDKTATDMVFSRSQNLVMLCCDGCADIVIDEQHPEYWSDCDNCGCRLPIN